jgi:predicted phosphodiesterase
MKQTSKSKSEAPHTTLLKELVLRFPDAPNLTLAKKFVKDYPQFIISVEQARAAIRTLKGKSGEWNRNHAHIDFRAEYEKALTKFKKELPKGETEKKEPYHLPKASKKILIIGDIHIPYHDDNALFAALKHGAECQVDTIIINGDLLDFAMISRHEKDLRKRSVGYEIATAKTFLEGLRAMFPKALIVFKEGNHDTRYQKWIMQKAPELLDIDGTSLSELLGLIPLRITHIHDKQIIYAGKMAILHGHEIGLTSGGVNPARSVRLKLNKSAIVNHFHRETKDMGKNLGEQPYSCYSNGCLCDLHPEYMGVHTLWTHGFTILDIDKHGNYKVQQKSIIDGVIY